MYKVDIAEVVTNEEGIAEMRKVMQSRTSHLLSIEDAVMYIKNMIRKEPAPPNTFFKIHGNGSLGYADSFGNPLPIPDWDKFSAALCDARGWVYNPEKMQF